MNEWNEWMYKINKYEKSVGGNSWLDLVVNGVFFPWLQVAIPIVTDAICDVKAMIKVPGICQIKIIEDLHPNKTF